VICSRVNASAATAKPTVVSPQARPSSACTGTMTANTMYRICEAASSSPAQAGTARPRHSAMPEVRDDGGAPSEAGARWQPGFGLISMRERAAELGGSCQAGPDPAGGGRVTARLPLAQGQAGPVASGQAVPVDHGQADPVSQGPAELSAR